MKTALLFICALALAVGCAPTKTITGKWSVEGIGSAGQGLEKVTADFADGGQMTMVFLTSNELPQDLGTMKMEMTMTGDYKMEGEGVTLNATDIKLKMIDLPEKLKPMEADIMKAFDAEQKQSMLDDINQSKASPIEWTSDSEFTMKTDGAPAVFTRA